MSEGKLWALSIPWLLLPSTALVFKLAAQLAGQAAGYLIGFAFYWLVWCLAIPWLALGRQPLTALLAGCWPLWTRRNWLAALMWLTVMAGAVGVYGPDFVRAPWLLLLTAVPFALFNGVCEEILWRGLYVRLFPRNPWLAILYPALGFAVWHLAPQVIFPAENVIVFVLSTFLLALPYGYIAYRTGSAEWTAISHSLSGVLALSGYLAPSALALFGGGS